MPYPLPHELFPSPSPCPTLPVTHTLHLTVDVLLLFGLRFHADHAREKLVNLTHERAALRRLHDLFPSYGNNRKVPKSRYVKTQGRFCSVGDQSLHNCVCWVCNLHADGIYSLVNWAALTPRQDWNPYSTLTRTDKGIKDGKWHMPKMLEILTK